MAKVLVCDRCGKKLQNSQKCTIGTVVYRYRFFKETSYDDNDYDLCPACEKAFEEFMKGPSEGSKELERPDDALVRAL